MSDFRKITEHFYASPQISPEDIAEAKSLGVSLIVNNRPDGEAEDQPTSQEIESAARAAGLDYIAIPVTHAGFSNPQIAELQRALAGMKEGDKVLAFCRSGTRSTLLWALASAASGDALDDITAAAESGGYSVAPVQAMMEMLVAKVQS